MQNSLPVSYGGEIRPSPYEAAANRLPTLCGLPEQDLQAVICLADSGRHPSPDDRALLLRSLLTRGRLMVLQAHQIDALTGFLRLGREPNDHRIAL